MSAPPRIPKTRQPNAQPAQQGPPVPRLVASTHDSDVAQQSRRAASTRRNGHRGPLSLSCSARTPLHMPSTTDQPLDISTSLGSSAQHQDQPELPQRDESPTPTVFASVTDGVPTVTQHPQLLREAFVPHASSFYDPHSWMKQFKLLRAAAVKSKDLIALGHKSKAVVTSKSAVRSACVVRVLPSVDAIKAALRKPSADRRRRRYDMWESVSLASPSRWDPNPYPTTHTEEGGESVSVSRTTSQARGASPQSLWSLGREAPATKLYMSPPAVWAIGGVNDSEVNVYEAFSGRPLMRIRDPKANVPAVSLLHAPFRGFMNRQLNVLAVREPADLLRVKSSQLIETDWVWVGFTDGSIRLFPANPSRIRASDRAEQFSKGELADLVYELPKYHNASVIAIARSPCHHDDDGADLSTLNRLSTAVQYMTAAGAEDGDTRREHLSLMCTASVDSSVVIWDVRRIYQTLEAMRMTRREALGGTNAAAVNSGASRASSARLSTSGRASAYFAGSVYAGETITLEGFPTPGGEETGGGPAFSVRSSCTLIKVRPLMRLKGGVASLKTMHWVSTLVTTEDYLKGRRETEMTRDAEEPSAPKLIRVRRPFQTLTRFERREEHRHSLRLNEADMREVEEELRRMMPPLAQEPLQALRVNLILASDNVGTVHIWNLDEELARKVNDPFNDLASSMADSARHTPRHRSPRTGRTAASESLGRSSVGACSAASPSVQLSAMEGPTSLRTQQQRQQRLGTALSASAADAREGAPVKTPKRKKSATGGGVATRTTRPTLSTSTPKRGAVSTAAAATAGTRTPAKHTTTASATPTASRGAAGARVRKGPARSSVSPARAREPRVRGSVVAGHGSRASSARAGTMDRSHLSASVEPDSDRHRHGMSKMQLLAVQRGDRSTPIREMNHTMDAPAGGMGGGTPDSERRGRRSISLAQPTPHSARRRTAKKSASRPRATGAVQEDGEQEGKQDASFAAVNPSRASTRWSPMRASVRLGSHDRGGGDEYPAESARRRQKSPSVPAAGGAATRRSPSRRAGSAESASQQRALNEYLSRASRCRIEFTDGAGIDGMAVDLPPRLVVTLRRIPDPEERQVSLLEEPTPEEVERRLLENSFEKLTEDRALFFVFQRLQLYLAVDGTVLNLRSVPTWQQRDEDGRDLFAQRGAQDGDRTVAPHQLRAETIVDGNVELTSAFSIGLRKLVLETHSQPVTELFLDHGGGHIWVARGDGLLSLFSKRSKKIVTRVPHPCADAALGPPNQKVWRAQQRERVLGLASGTSPPPRVEWPRECRNYDPAHFSQFLPLGSRTQVAVMLTANARTVKPEHGTASAGRLDSLTDLATNHSDGSPLHSPLVDVLANSTFTPSQHQRKAAAGSRHRNPVPHALSSLMRLASGYVLDGASVSKSMAVAKVDGCSDLGIHAQRREVCFSTLLNQILWCRVNADVVRRTQKAYYESLCAAVGENVRHVIGEIGAYTALATAHRSYDLWREHVTQYPRSHVMRVQRRTRLARSGGAASAMARALLLKLAGDKFRMWLLWTAQRRRQSNANGVARIVQKLHRDDELHIRCFTASLFLHLLRMQQRCAVYDAWRSWAHTKRREAVIRTREAQQLAARGKKLSASPPNQASARQGSQATVQSLSPPMNTPAGELDTVSPLTASHQGTEAGTCLPDGDDTLTQRSDNGGVDAPSPPDSLPGDSPRATSPLVRTFTRRYSTSSSPRSRKLAATRRYNCNRSNHKESDDDDEEGNGQEDDSGAIAEAGTTGEAFDDLLAANPFLTVFLEMLRLLYLTRPAIMLFRESRNLADSVLDESWMSIVESAEGAADTDDEQGRRLGVFSFGLLPLLQGLLSTADDVLPNLHESSVAEEVLSMLNGIQLCMDYVAADAEDALGTAEAASGGAVPGHRSSSSPPPAYLFTSPEKAYMRMLSSYAFQAVRDAESQQAMREIAAEMDSLEAFVSFVEDDRLDTRRRTSVSLH